MTAIETPEYKKLALDSSNDMIRHDARRGDREFEKAALHIQQAGFARLRMGQIMFDAGEYSYAAEDWLSAAACFYLVPDLNRMREAFARAQTIAQAGQIPLERRDLRAAIQERETQITTLEQKLARFHQEYSHVAGPMHAASQESLDWLLRQVRELPSYPPLHIEIYQQARQLGQITLATEHLGWAEKFDPDNPSYRTLRATALVAS